jgi:ABC-2 type transport system ATP-binding protein
MIHAKDLRKRFGKITAVDGISLDISAGETFGLLGPNGAGKSTTIHLLTGALKPDEGVVTLDGQIDPTRAAVRQSLGVAPQTDALYKDLTGEENIRFFGSLFRMGAGLLEERVKWTLDFVGLYERRHDLLRTYSGGMKRRLNLACALVHDPKVVFLDEPTAGVDPQSRNHLLNHIEKLSDQGRTILYTTHYMEEAQRLCDRVAIMDHGKILALDSVPNLVARLGGLARVEAELAEIPSASVPLPGKLLDNFLTFENAKPFEKAVELTAAGLRFRSFKVEPPNLETVFLNLTGRGLRD